MNRKDARKIAEEISNDELMEMFKRAKQEINDWETVSRTNKGLSRGVAWNILASDFNPKQNYHIMAKQNMIREFGEYLPDYLQPTKRSQKPKSDGSYTHIEPDFSNWE